MRECVVGGSSSFTEQMELYWNSSRILLDHRKKQKEGREGWSWPSSLMIPAHSPAGYRQADKGRLQRDGPQYHLKAVAQETAKVSGDVYLPACFQPSLAIRHCLQLSLRHTPRYGVCRRGFPLQY